MPLHSVIPLQFKSIIIYPIIKILKFPEVFTDFFQCKKAQ